MEEILLFTLQSRHKRLIDAINSAKTVLELLDTGVSIDKVTASQIQLRNLLVQFKEERDRCLNTIKTLDFSLFKEYLEDSLTAEDLLTKFDVVHKLHTNNSEKTQQARLPKLDLGKFNGNVLNWCSFWDRFAANVHDKPLADVEKLSYLVASLEGEALQAIDGLETTNINYQVAVSLLKERFGKRDRVVDAHNKALQDLSQTQGSGVECRRTLNIIERHLRVLEAMGEGIDSSHLRVIIMSKFPENILYQVNLLTTNDSSIASIRAALNTVVTALEQSTSKAESSTEASVVPQVASTSTLHAKTEMNPSRKRKWNKDNHKQHQMKRDFKTNRIQLPIQKKKSRLACVFCNGGHYSEDCDKYQSYSERKQQLQRRCFICFQNGHRASMCPKKRKCPHCGKTHNRALCRLKTKEGKTHKLDFCIDTSVNTFAESSHFLQTAVAQALQGVNRKLTCRILLDSGSQRSYVTNHLAQELQLVPDSEDQLAIYTFGSTKPQEITSPSAEITILTKRLVQRKIRVNIVTHITDRVRVANINLPELDIVADDDSVGQGIDLLIGNDYYFSFIKNNHMKLQDQLYVVDSDFGWIITGCITEEVEKGGSALSVVTYCNCHDANCPYFTEPDLPLRSIDMKFLWALESIGITDSPKTTIQEETVHYFNESIKYNDGRYQVKWPWIQYPPELPTNFGLALGRLKSLLRRADREMLDTYEEILKEQLDAGVIEEVEPIPLAQLTHPVHYLPHHLIKQRNKRGRIVYDASAKIKDQKSLNECLYQGPSMLEDLTGLILKFRMDKVAIIADVEKAFLQVGLQVEDRDVTRFLWIKDPSKEVTDENLLHLRFCRVPFGIISSPFLLAATIRHHISKTENSLMSKIADRCYVDNLVTSVNSIDEALHLYKKTNCIFNELGMNIRDWMSNEIEFIEKIPEVKRGKQVEKVKILGLIWDMNNDILHLNIDTKALTTEIDQRGITKKGVLKVLARLYDPCGYASPLVLPGKLLFQELCTRKLKWDTVLPDDLRPSWENIIRNLDAINSIKVPRYVGSAHRITERIISYELHGFTDASLNFYATVVYLRIIGENKIDTAFLMSKSRITPIEDKTDLKIPRLELLAFLIGSRLMKYVKDHIEIDLSKLFLWTDSQVVLAWMKTNKLLPPFISRRVDEIKKTSRSLGMELCYIHTKENPADIATRPELWQKKQDLWTHGPAFLTKDQQFWPKAKMDKDEVCLASRALDIIDGPEMTLKGYESDELGTSNISDLGSEAETRPSATKPNPESDATIDEIKELQRSYFPEEVMGKKTSLSLNLGLFIDEVGLLRSKGRLGHTNWPYDKKYPILIPRSSPFTNRVIQKTHEENYHVGVPHTLSIIRHKYWIPQGRAQVQKVIKKCQHCLKHGGGPYQLPPAPALPSERVNYSSPFTYTGLDYLGPVLVDNGKGREKRWICLLTCLAVRALHLEIVKDLSAEECLLAIRRFTSTRKVPEVIISDNALQFKLTSEVLTSPYCKEKGIRWKFIAQLAPWQGAFYERLVALVKHCLKRTLDKHILSDSQMSTVIKEVEAILNTRPLTAVGSDLEEVLTPANFLTLGQCLESDMDSQASTLGITSTKAKLIESWKRGQMILEEYKRMFVNQYLPSLRERYFHTHKQPRVISKRSPEIGDIVQIKDDSKNRVNWRVGKIVSLIKSHDGQCRVAKVKVNNTEFTRSIGHLYPLEADMLEESLSVDNEGKYDQDTAKNIPQSVPEANSQQQEALPPETNTDSTNDLNRDPVPDISTLRLSPLTGNDNPPEQEEDINDDVTSMPSEQCESAPVQVEQVGPTERSQSPSVDLEIEPLSDKRRDAAIKARKKIAEWTRHLLNVL